MAKRIGDWPVVEQIARAYREIEPLNEEAWLALAEAKCLTSSNACALATLDEYRARLGEQEPTAARLFADSLTTAGKPTHRQGALHRRPALAFAGVARPHVRRLPPVGRPPEAGHRVRRPLGGQPRAWTGIP